MARFLLIFACFVAMYACRPLEEMSLISKVNREFFKEIKQNECANFTRIPPGMAARFLNKEESLHENLKFIINTTEKFYVLQLAKKDKAYLALKSKMLEHLVNHQYELVADTVASDHHLSLYLKEAQMDYADLMVLIESDHYVSCYNLNAQKNTDQLAVDVREIDSKEVMELDEKLSSFLN